MLSEVPVRIFLQKKINIASFLVFLFFWTCSALRHFLLNSNAYDLGLFDQWIWLVSKGLPPYSSMEGVHLLADHGAWVLYFAALPYKFYPSLQWLLATQAACLSFTAIPIWFVGRQAGLTGKFCWLVCLLWWLQPVVFNANLFDFHPEVWAMPALAGSYWANRANKPWIWISLLLFLLGCRDGLVLVVAGLGIEQAFRRRWAWSASAIGLALAWLAFLNRLVYPLLTGTNAGPKAAANLFPYLGNTLDEVLINLITKPNLLISNVDWGGGLIYLLLISIAVFPLWRNASIPVLLGSIPLVFVNLISQEAPQRTLIHHYSLPIAVIVIIAVIDGLAVKIKQPFPLKALAWSAVCWAALAKPWFFTGPYLARFDSVVPVYQALNSIPDSSRVITTSYLVPHLSNRANITFPRDTDRPITLENVDVLLLNPKDPGWASSSQSQLDYLLSARKAKWNCKTWSIGLELCQRP